MNYSIEQAGQDYDRIEAALTYLEAHFNEQPTLQQVAAKVYLSEYHFQKLFSRWVGISPKRFLQFLTKEYAKRLLQESRNVLDVTFESGLSSPGRLHDLLVNCEAVTPGEYKSGGDEVTIEYGFHPTPFGECLLALTRRGICALEFVKNSQRTAALEALQQKWTAADFSKSSGKTALLVEEIFQAKAGGQSAPFHLHLRGTNFQLKVWEALLHIPYAHLVAYDDIATYIGKPKAVRAVANALGKNPVPFLIPCHRVIKKMGESGGYSGGTARKRALIGWEAAMRETKGERRYVDRG